jgi:hypothetical protein
MKNIKNKKARTIIIVNVVILLGFVSWYIGSRFTAEKVGSSPESGSTSMLKELSTTLTTLGYGLITKTPDWGEMWNRVYTAATWNATLGNAGVGDVADGKFFYAGANRTLLEGTAVGGAVINYGLQGYSFREDYAGPTNSNGAEDNQWEESTWTNPATNVWKDERTGLYWTTNAGHGSNSFIMSSCPFFSITPPTSLATYNGANGNCGYSINFCANLTYGGRSDWYLPSQKEMMQAFIDGMYNKAGTTLANAAAFTNLIYIHICINLLNDLYLY